MAEAQRRKERVAPDLARERRLPAAQHARFSIRMDGRCFRCGDTYRLPIHHRQFRSHGGTHGLENLSRFAKIVTGLIHGVGNEWLKAAASRLPVIKGKLTSFMLLRNAVARRC